MILRLLITTLVLVSFNAGAQNMNQVFEDSLMQNRTIRLTSFNAYSATSLNNEFISKFLYGGQITNSIKEDNEQKNFNAAGGEFNQKIEYFEGNFLQNRPNIGLTVAISDNNFASTNYKPSVWNIAFYGNANYLDDTLDLSFSHFQYLHFQKYEIGIYEKSAQSYVRLGFISGNRSINYSLGNSSFYTSATGDEMYLRLRGEGYSTDSVSSYFSGSGYGASLEINHNFIFDNKKGNKQIINFNLSNLGLIFWNKETNFQIIDSSYHFNGIDYSAIQDYNNYTVDDIIDTLNITEGQNSRRESLPIRIGIQKVAYRNADTKIQSIFGFKAILIPDYRPLVYGGVYYKPYEFMSVSSRLVLGGFGGLKAGLNLNFWSNNKLYVGIGTNDLIGAVSNKYGRGKDLNFTLHVNF